MLQLEELFLPYDLALLAKENKFDESCFASYINDKINPRKDWQLIVGSIYKYIYNDNDTELDFIIAPLYQQIIDWFRKKHKLHIYIREFVFEDKIEYIWVIRYVDSKRMKIAYAPTGKLSIRYTDYYKTLQLGISEAFKMINN